MKVVGVGGSVREGSYTYKLLASILEQIHQSKKVSTELVDLRQLHLPFCDGSAQYPSYPDVEVLREKVYSANGILLATPEYHGGVSGALKNALDLLDEPNLKGKVIGLISVVGGEHSNNAINALRIICRQLHCWVLPEQIVIPHAANNINNLGQLKDPHLNKRLTSMIDHFIDACSKLKSS